MQDLPGWKPGDKELIEEVNALKPEALRRIMTMPDGYLEVC